MKRLLSISLVVILTFLFTACNKVDNNKYVQSAKANGYWYGLGGISWGMNIDETLAVLKLTREDTKDILKEEFPTNDVSTYEGFKINGKMFGLDGQIKFFFSTAKNEDAGVLATTEWLSSINFQLDRACTDKEITTALEKEMSALKLTYNMKARSWTNEQTLSDVGEKTTALYEKLFMSSTGVREGYIQNPSLDTLFITGTENGDVSNVNFNGTGAAIIALSE